MINDNEKKYVYVALLIIIIVLTIVLIMIWKPLFTLDTSFDEQLLSYESISGDVYNKEILNKYFTLAKKYIDIKNIDSLSNVLDKDFLQSNNLNEEDVKEFILSQDFLINYNSSVVLYNSSIKSDGKRYIYTYSYRDGNSNEKKIHFIEEYFGKYKISFEQDGYPILNNETYNSEIDNINFEIKVIKSYEQSILLQISISNNSSEEVTFDIGSVDKVIIRMNDLYDYKLSTVIAGQESSFIKLTPGAKRQVNLSFAVPLENQKTITNLSFKSVKFTNGELKDMVLEIK